MSSATLPASQDLSRDEHLLWSGVPRQGLVLSSSDAFLIPFSILWAGFAVFWEVSVLASGGPGFFALWGIPFVAMGLYITIGRFFVDRIRRARTSYALTSQRIIIRSGRNTQSLMLAALSDISINERPNRTGTLTFGTAPFPMSVLAGSGWPGVKGPPMLEQIPEARRVFDQIRTAQRTAITERAVYER
jgi:hypothetical protein